MAIILFHSMMLTLANESTWQDKIRASISPEQRVAFGQHEISDSQSVAIAGAKKLAMAQLASTFLVKVASESSHYISYQESSHVKDGRKFFSTTNISLQQDELELAGVDLNNVFVDNKNNLVVAAAIINLKDYEKYLENKISNITVPLKEDQITNICPSLQYLSQLKGAANPLAEIIKIEKVLFSFTSYASSNIKLYEKIKTGISRCRNRIQIDLSSVHDDFKSEIHEYLKSHNFVLNKPNNSNSSFIAKVVIKIEQETTEPVNKFDQMNVTGFGKITYQILSEPTVVWKTKTIRQIASSPEMASLKAKIRIKDEILLGISEIVEGHL